MTHHIVLDDDDARWTVEGRRIEVIGVAATTTYTLPKGCRRVAVQKAGRNRLQLVMGGFNTTTVAVTGPAYVINKLKREVLA